jgi:cytochrome P450
MIIPVNIVSREFKANPYPFYAQMRAESPVYQLGVPLKGKAWFVARYDDVTALLKDDRFIKDESNAQIKAQKAKQRLTPNFLKPIMRNMLMLDGDDHTRLRGLVHKGFTPRIIEDMRVGIETLTNELIDQVAARGSMDLIEDFALPIPTTVIAQMLGVPLEDRHKFHQWSAAVVAAGSGSTFATLRAIPALYAFVNYIRGLVKLRRAEPQDDLISALIAAQEAGDQLSEDELVGMIFLMLIAGHETTVNLIGNGTLALLEHPDQLALLRDNPVLAKSAVEELLRFTSPVETADERFTREDVMIAGVTIPQGSLVYGVIASANRDPQQFDNPDTLDITRANNKHLAFSQGIHYCLGAPLARMEAQIAFNTLLHRLPDLTLAAPVASLRWRPAIMLRGLEALPVTFTPQPVIEKIPVV